MEIKEVKQQSRESKIAWEIGLSLALLVCCYCGVFVFPWGANRLIMAFGITFLAILMYSWLPLKKLNKWLGLSILAAACVLGVYAILSLRNLYIDNQLEKYGVTTIGEVVTLFKESRGRYGTSKVDMAKIAYRYNGQVIYNDIENRKKQIHMRDRVKLIYSSKDPNIFTVLKIDKPITDQANDQTSGYNPNKDLRGIPKPVTFLDGPPEFKGGMQAFYAYLRANLIYPQTARDQRIAGKVHISFVIAADGSVHDVKVDKGIGGGCDEAAIEVVKNMPKWKPGMQNGKPVRVKYNIPISFSL